MIGKCRKIFVGNYKGGVGKTTSAYSIAQCLAVGNIKVLLLDLDPQSSLSEICLKNAKIAGKDSLKKLNEDETLNFVFDLGIKNIEKYANSIKLEFDKTKLIKKLQNKNVYFVPSSLNYRDGLGLDQLVMNMKDTVIYHNILNSFIKEIEHHFDFIIIDCPPTSNIITHSAFLLSDFFIIPTILDGISTNGVIHYINSVISTYSKCCSSSNEDYLFNKLLFGEQPKLLGIFYTFIRSRVNYEEDKKLLTTELSNFEDNYRPIKEKMIQEIDEEVSENSKLKYLKEEIYVFDNCIHNYVDTARKIAVGDVDEDQYMPIVEELLTRL